MEDKQAIDEALKEKHEWEGNRILKVIGCEYNQSKIEVVKVNGDVETYTRAALSRGECTVRDGFALTEDEMNPIAEAVRDQIGREFGADHRGTLGYYKRIFRAGLDVMLSAAPKVDSGWRDISSAPKDKWLLVIDNANRVYNAVSYNGVMHGHFSEYEPIREIKSLLTHWMPLPPKPTEGE